MRAATTWVLLAGFLWLSVLLYLHQRQMRRLLAVVDVQAKTIELDIRQLRKDAEQLGLDAIMLDHCAGVGVSR